MERIVAIDTIKLDISRHLRVLGQTGSGKSTLLEYIATKSQPFIFLDPHGRSASQLLSCVQHAAYFDVSDVEYPFQFNPMSGVRQADHPKLAGAILDNFHVLFGDSWGPQLETILLCSLRAVLYTDKPSLLAVYMMLTSPNYRASTIPRINDTIIRKFWTEQFQQWEQRLQVERTWSTMNKILQLLADPTLRNIISTRNRFDLRKNTIVNLSGISEHHQKLLGSLILGHVLLNPQPLTVVIDEAQYFNQHLLAHMIATVRKWGIALVVGHQYLSQFDTKVQDALLNTVGALVLYQVSAQDAEKLTQGTHLIPRDILTVQQHHAYIIRNGNDVYAQMPGVRTRYKGRTKRIHATRRNHCRPRRTVELEVEKLLDEAYATPPRSPSNGRWKRSKKRV